MSQAQLPGLPLDWAYHWENNTPHKVYLTQPLGGGEVRDYTWHETMDETRRMAAHLQSLNLPPKSQIALLSKNMAHWIMTDLAIWMAGHVTVPVFPTLTADAVRQILEHSESKLLFVGKLDGWDAMKSGVPDGMAMIGLPLAPPLNAPKWEEIVKETDPMRENPTRDAGDMATIIYTSGSTGVPKGVMQSFGAMAAVTDSHEEIQSTADDRMLSYLPLAHTFERAFVECTSLRAGFHVFFAESLDTFVQDLQRARPTFFISVPRLWVRFQMGVFAKLPEKKLERLLSIPILSSLIKKKVLKGLGLDKVRVAGSGSAPIPPEVITWYRRLGLELLEGYGMTENASYSHVNRTGNVHVGSVGEAQPGVEVKIGADSEILVKSPGNMMGYFKAPEQTAETFTADGFLKTGDTGEIDANGILRITGRLKELFKTAKGKYVAPAPIENKLMNHPMVEQACVSGAGQPQPHALILLGETAQAQARTAEGKAAIEAAMKAHLDAVNATVETYETLEFLAIVSDQWLTENGFLTPTMKVKRNVIEKTYNPMAPAWYAQREPVVWQAAS